MAERPDPRPQYLRDRSASVEGVEMSEARVPEEAPITVEDEPEASGDGYTGPDPEEDPKATNRTKTRAPKESPQAGQKA